jgi:hypothetical protein
MSENFDDLFPLGGNPLREERLSSTCFAKGMKNRFHCWFVLASLTSFLIAYLLGFGLLIDVDLS